MPLISVIIPSRVGEELESIKSIERQTYKNLEIIIEYDYYERGASATRNTGALKASGEYILFCDNDINLVPDAIESMYNAIKDTDYAWCFGKLQIGETILNEDRQQIDYSLTGKEFVLQFKSISTVSLIKSYVKPIFDISMMRNNDWDLWLRMTLDGHKAYFLNKILFTTKDRDFGQGISTGLHGTASAWEKEIMRRYEKRD